MATQLWALNFRDVLVAKGAIPSEVAGRSPSPHPRPPAPPNHAPPCHRTRAARLFLASQWPPPSRWHRSLGLGGECYGRVTRVGADVTSVAPGDLALTLSLTRTLSLTLDPNPQPLILTLTRASP